MNLRLFKAALTLLIVITSHLSEAREFFVDPLGKNTNQGIINSPFFHLQTAADKANPGDTIYVRGGIYNYQTRVTLKETSGTQDNPIMIFAYQDEKPILDFSSLSPGNLSQGIRIESHYWHLRGLEVRNAGSTGFKIGEGNHNIIENCVAQKNHGSGFGLGFSHDEMGNEDGERCAYNTILNCDAYLNFDYSSNSGNSPGTNADGFSCKMRAGKGNKFIGCRSWRNSDDGWDLFESGFAVLIENCWTWRNGEFSDFIDIYNEKYGKVLTESLFSGDGNGIKIGGNHTAGSPTCTNQSRGTHIIRNCIAFGHIKANADGHKGFDQNNHKDGAYFENCLAFSNNENFRFWAEANPGRKFYFTNCISFDTRGRGNLFVSESTFKTNSWDLGLAGDPEQFLSLSEEHASASRKADGSLPGVFGRLTENSLFIDKGTLTETISVDGLFVDPIPFTGENPDLGAYETGLLSSINPAQRNGSFTKNWNGEQLVIQNSNIKRIVVLKDGVFTTQSYRLTDCPYNFVSITGKEPIPFNQKDESNRNNSQKWNGNDPEEFSFLLNDVEVTGKSGWIVLGVEEDVDGQERKQQIKLKGISDVNQNLEITVTYLTYTELPVVRKKIAFRNLGTDKLKIESLSIESLNIPWGNTYNIVWQNYGRYKHIGPFLGNWDDPLVISHNPELQLGIAIGNEAPGILKRTSVCLDGRTINAGLTHANQDYAFRKWLNPGESWESTYVFSGLFSGRNPRDFIEGPVNNFVKNHMGIRISEIAERPIFVYNTWNPFRRNVNEKLIMELTDAAASCGVEEFIIDDGWQVGFGDWEIDYEKFPNGLKPVFDYIKSKGMKPGLWLSMGAASPGSKVFKDHPEWFVKYRDGNFVNLHSNSTDRYSACFSTGWKDYIKDKILNLVKEHGLEYVKLDFAIVASAYRFNPDVSGCFAKNHSHNDRQESYLEIYRRAWQLFDELHAEAPNLFIDCTFETMGELQMIDYDMCKHAEGNWLSNFEDSAPYGSERVRQMSWWRSSVIPATTMVIGNQSINDDFALYSFKSLCGSLPIMLGDPRKVSEEEQRQFRELSEWLRAMEEKHQIMLFRQDLKGFGEPGHGSWDGFQRINSETNSGGIVGVFKQFSQENERRIFLNHLDPNKKYLVTQAPNGKIVSMSTGEELNKKGFNVSFNNNFQGELYEISEYLSK